MLLRRIKLVIICLVCFLLQGNVVHYFSIKGGVPDLILLVTLSYTFLDDLDSVDGLVAGVAAGFVKDICYGQIVGTSSLLYLAIGGLMIYMKRHLNNESKIILFFVTVIATVMFVMGQWLLCVVFTQAFPGIVRELIRLPGTLFWNILLMLLISRIYDRRRRRSHFVV